MIQAKEIGHSYSNSLHSRAQIGQGGGECAYTPHQLSQLKENKSVWSLNNKRTFRALL